MGQHPGAEGARHAQDRRRLPFDTQRDMFCNLLGAGCAVACSLPAIRHANRRRVAKEAPATRGRSGASLAINLNPRGAYFDFGSIVTFEPSLARLDGDLRVAVRSAGLHPDRTASVAVRCAAAR